MPGIDPTIVVHEIKTYPDAKPVWQRLRQIHPRKAIVIKAEVERLLKAGFIYLIPLTDWVSNIVPINKKYNQINILPVDQLKTAFIFPWETFSYFKLPFGLKNAEATFHRDMSYAFHDIKHIVKPYLDDFPAHSLHRADHLIHLRIIFMRCRHYWIRLKPHEYVFCIETGWLLGFVVSKAGICVDPSKVEAVVKLPPPSSLR
eukprot:PITA_36305